MRGIYIVYKIYMNSRIKRPVLYYRVVTVIFTWVGTGWGSVPYFLPYVLVMTIFANKSILVLGKIPRHESVCISTNSSLVSNDIGMLTLLFFISAQTMSV